MAVLRRLVEPAQYTSLAFGRRCQAAGVRPSMGSVGDAYDHALGESFFATLECELLDRRRFATPTQARLAVFDFIEGWYNPHRRHSALDYESPMRRLDPHAARGTSPAPHGVAEEDREAPQRRVLEPPAGQGVVAPARRRAAGTRRPLGRPGAKHRLDDLLPVLRHEPDGLVHETRLRLHPIQDRFAPACGGSFERET